MCSIGIKRSVSDCFWNDHCCCRRTVKTFVRIRVSALLSSWHWLLRGKPHLLLYWKIYCVRKNVHLKYIHKQNIQIEWIYLPWYKTAFQPQLWERMAYPRDFSGFGHVLHAAYVLKENGILAALPRQHHQ